MTKATRSLSYGFLFLVFWASSLMEWIALPSIVNEKLLPPLPLWMVVTYGAYSLCTIGWNLITFGDCPKAYEELMKEIELAREDLRKNKVSVD